MDNVSNQYRFQLEKYYIRLEHLTFHTIYFIKDTFYGTKYHFFIENNPEEFILRDLPISLHNKVALKDLCNQIPEMKFFYPDIMKLISYQVNFDEKQKYPVSNNTFIHKKDSDNSMKLLLK